MAQSENKVKTPLDFLARMRMLSARKDTVEVICKDYEVSGRITEIGEDYLGVTYAVEKEIVKRVPVEGVEGKFENQTRVVSMEMEAFIKFEMLLAIARITKSVER